MLRTAAALLKSDGWHSKYPSIEKFLHHYMRKTGSEGTRENCLWVLSQFCEFTEMNPNELVKLTSARASKTVQEFLDFKLKKDVSKHTLNVQMAMLRIFFRVNGFKNGREIEVERYHQPTRYRKNPEYIPTPEEVQKMAYAAGSPQGRALVLATYTSGLRNSTMRALLYRDVRSELEKGNDIVKIPVYPEMKRVEPEACKGNIPYYSFISKEAVLALKEYLRTRGKVEDDDLLFCSTCTNVASETRSKTAIKDDTLFTVVKRAARKAGIAEWMNVYPHCLRKAFESALRNARLDPKDQEFLMGHILPGSQDTYYDKTKVDQLREKYSAVRFFGALIEDIKKESKLEALRSIAETVFKMDPMKLRMEKRKSIGRELSTDEELELLQSEIKKPKTIRQTAHDGNGHFETKLATEDELIPSLNEGWDIVKELSNGKIVLRRVATDLALA